MGAWAASLIPEGSDFTLDNLPWGVFRDDSTAATICVAVGDHVLDMRYWAENVRACEALEIRLPADTEAALARPNLTEFLSLGKEHWLGVRKHVRATLEAFTPAQADSMPVKLLPMAAVTMLLPFPVTNYTDFYASKAHATNVGSLFRGRENALSPNWLHMPIAYHGRASSVLLSGASVRRPWGQAAGGDAGPKFAPTAALDFELELAAVLGGSTQVGAPIKLKDAGAHIFGYMLLNDLSARDIQKWEYVPLGPFNGKNFASVVSPWVVQHEALLPFRVDLPAQVPRPLPYLCHEPPLRGATFDIAMQASVRPAGADRFAIVSETNFRGVYWGFDQMLVHHTVGGCNVAAGDILGSGTVSTETPRGQGCLLELTRNGAEPLQLGGVERVWLQDGDTVRLHAYSSQGGRRIGFGDCDVQIAAALPLEAVLDGGVGTMAGP